LSWTLEGQRPRACLVGKTTVYAEALQFPKYEEIEEALIQELRSRSGSASPSDHDGRGRTVYEALADRFRRSREARDAVIFENGIARSKCENMVRWAARKLKDHGKLVRGLYGIWKIKEAR
jgi:hypothetical protein